MPLNIVAAGVEPPMSKAFRLRKHRALSLPRGPHRAAACSEPIAVGVCGFWVTPFELRVRNSFFGGDLCSRSRFNKVLQKDLSSDLRGAAVDE